MRSSAESWRKTQQQGEKGCTVDEQRSRQEYEEKVLDHVRGEEQLCQSIQRRQKRGHEDAHARVEGDNSSGLYGVAATLQPPGPQRVEERRDQE
jgi:hypothetical protein